MPRSHLPARSSAAERLAFVLLLGGSLIGAGCKRDGGGSSGPASSASAATSASPASPTSSGSAPAAAGSAVAPPADTDAPQGAGVEELVALASVAECQPKEVELGSCLQRGEIAIAARDGAIATSWM